MPARASAATGGLVGALRKMVGGQQPPQQAQQAGQPAGVPALAALVNGARGELV